MLKPSRRQALAGSAALPAARVLAARPPAERTPRNLLAGAISPEKLARVILPREQWKPFPTAADRAAWEQLPAEARQTLIEAGERSLKTAWQVLPATLFLEFKRIGNRSHYEAARDTRREKLRALVMAECAEAKGRFLDEIGNGIWLTCEETYWGLPAHLSAQQAGFGLPDVTEPTVDLFAAETSAQLAWTEYLLGPLIEKAHPLIRERLYLEVDRRVLAPNLKRIDFWWMGLDPKLNRTMNNWNPWINSNWLASALLVERDPQRRLAAFGKILRSLDVFLDSYHDDGGCDEGPGYWDRAGGSLFDNLELFHSASKGAIDFYNVPLVREIGRYIYRAHIHDDWYTNFADASAQVRIGGDMVFRYGQRIGDEKMQLLGAWAAQRGGVRAARGGSLGRQLPALFNLAAIQKAPASQALVRDVWLPGIQVMTARRKEGSAEGLYLAAQGGHNAESHNHNDVGNFMVYANGSPAIIDIGVETYSAKTFSAQRYEIWTMQSAYHNLPTIGGAMQAAGREYEATEVSYKAGEAAVEFSLNIAQAWPRQAGLESWRRRFRFDRAKNGIEVLDDYSLAKPAGRITLTLMTPCVVTESGAGELKLADKVKVLFDGGALKPVIEEIKVTDGRLRPVWGERLFRILLTAEKPPAKGTFRVRVVQG
jgi:hypothetical protein